MTDVEDIVSVKKALVVLTIEQTLLKMGGATLLNKIQSVLFNEFKAYLTDCYEKPEYLNAALKKIFGSSHQEIVKEIQRELDEYIDEGAISLFIEKIAV